MALPRSLGQAVSASLAVIRIHNPRARDDRVAGQIFPAACAGFDLCRGIRGGKGIYRIALRRSFSCNKNGLELMRNLYIAAY